VITLPLGGLEVVMLAGVRVAAFLMIAPPFANRGIPGTVKAMLAGWLAILVLPRATAAGGPHVGTTIASGSAAFVGELVLQVAIGAGLGFLVSLVFSAVQSAGNMIDLFGGFQMAQAFDPMSMSNGSQFTRLYQMTATVLLFTSGGYQLVIGGLLRTFEVLPLGAGFDFAALAQTATEGLTGMFLASLQIAGPLIAVLFLADIGLGLLTRVAPALNAFALGFPLKILLTIVLAVSAYVALPQVVDSLTGDAIEGMLGVAG
jgi:flagellar biosynthetic protein FliR